MSEEQRRLSQFTESVYYLWSCCECQAALAYPVLHRSGQARQLAGPTRFPHKCTGNVSGSFSQGPVSPQTRGHASRHQGQKALEPICLKYPLLLFCLPCRETEERGREEGRGEHTSASPRSSSLALDLACSLLPYVQGLFFFFFLIPFTVFQASLTDFKINLITLLLSIVKSKGEM